MLFSPLECSFSSLLSIWKRKLSFNIKCICYFPVKSPLISPRRVAQHPPGARHNTQRIIKRTCSPQRGGGGVQEENPHVLSNRLWVPAEQILRMSWSLLLQIKKFNYSLSGLHCLTLKCLNMRAFVFSKLHSLWKPLHTSGRRPSRGRAETSNDAGNM